MKKRLIDSMLGEAYRLLSEMGLAENDCISSHERSMVVEYSVEIMMETLLSATATFLGHGRRAGAYGNLLYVLLMKYKEGVEVENPDSLERDTLFHYLAQNDTYQTKDMVLHCIYALRMAMNLYLYEDVPDAAEPEEAEL